MGFLLANFAGANLRGISNPKFVPQVPPASAHGGGISLYAPAVKRRISLLLELSSRFSQLLGSQALQASRTLFVFSPQLSDARPVAIIALAFSSRRWLT